MRHERTVEINAQTERVFDLIDDPEKAKLWMDGLQETVITESTPNRVGSKFRQKIREGGRAVEYSGEVTAYEPQRRLAVRIAGKGFGVDVDYRLTPIDAGTRLDFTCDVTMTNWFTRLMGKLAAGMNRRIMDKQMAKLKAIAETG